MAARIGGPAVPPGSPSPFVRVAPSARRHAKQLWRAFGSACSRTNSRACALDCTGDAMPMKRLFLMTCSNFSTPHSVVMESAAHMEDAHRVQRGTGCTAGTRYASMRSMSRCVLSRPGCNRSRWLQSLGRNLPSLSCDLYFFGMLSHFNHTGRARNTRSTRTPPPLRLPPQDGSYRQANLIQYEIGANVSRGATTVVFEFSLILRSHRLTPLHVNCVCCVE
jgi:hypothetical protein